MKMRSVSACAAQPLASVIYILNIWKHIWHTRKSLITIKWLCCATTPHSNRMHGLCKWIEIIIKCVVEPLSLAGAVLCQCIYARIWTSPVTTKFAGKNNNLPSCTWLIFVRRFFFFFSFLFSIHPFHLLHRSCQTAAFLIHLAFGIL